MLYILLYFFSANASAVEDVDLAESLIALNDCDNALPILVSIYKHHGNDKKKILLNINRCAEIVLNYTLKENSEQKLLQLNPEDHGMQLRYLDSLFYLSKYQSLIAFSQKQKDLHPYDDYWMLLGRSLYEINENEKSIAAFEAYLKRKATKKSDEAYYWLIKNYIQIEEYGKARVYLTKLAQLKDLAPWLVDKITGLQDFIDIKDRRFSFSAKVQGGTDDNILRTYDKISDTTTLTDLNFDYKLINKANNSLTLGLDINYQGYARYTDYQTISVAPRLGQSIVLFNKIRTEYLISVGKIQTNFKADQNYFFIANYYYIPLSQAIELQPVITYFEYLNINPIKQYNVSFLINFYLAKSFFWIGPYYAQSNSPEAVIDATTYIVPVVTKYSLTTRYNKAGLILGYQISLTDSWSLLAQYSMGQLKYAEIDLSSYNTTKVNDFEGRIDSIQNLKLTAAYRYSAEIRYNLSLGYISNNSKGFAGFNTPLVPNNNYNQMQGLLGITYKMP